MKIIKQQVKDLDSFNYYQMHLLLISPFLPVEITPKEREVLGLFMSFEGELANVDRFGTSFRKIVRETLEMSTGGLTNHLTSLKNKGVIYTTVAGTLAVKEFLFPDEKEQGYQFKINKK